jgi:hypothetical protein
MTNRLRVSIAKEATGLLIGETTFSEYQGDNSASLRQGPLPNCTAHLIARDAEVACHPSD